MMKLLTQQDIKKSEIETLRIFRDFCEKNNLKYYLAFGTLLGAVRHRGFIPWDDDIDILMPRPDYNYLLVHFNDFDHNRRKIISKQNTPDFYSNIAKIIDRNTILTETGQSLVLGVWIDIFPMDFLPGNTLKRCWKVFLFYWLNLLLAYSGITYRKGRIWYKNFIVRIFLLICPLKSRLDSRYQKEIAKMAQNAPGKYYGLIYKYLGASVVPVLPVSFFDPSIKLEFEGELYDAPANYDKLLRYSYGDYMTLPPAEQQKSHHSYICYWNESFPEEQK